MTTPRSRRSRYLPLGGIVLASVLWSGYWFASSQIASAAIARATSAIAERGPIVDCDGDAAVGGFPLSLDLSCERATLQIPDQEMSAAISLVAATAPLYRPGHVEARVGGPFVFDAPGLGIALSASWTRAVANVDAGMRGVIRAVLELDGLKVVRSGNSGTLPFVRLVAANASFAATPDADGAYQFASSAKGMQVIQAPDKSLPQFDSEARITALDFGPSLGTDPGKTLSKWLASGGTMRVDQLSFVAGATSIAASGNLTISKAGLLSGAITLRFAGLDGLPDLVERVQPGTRKNVANAVAILSAVTMPLPTAKGFDRQTVLFFRNGVVSVGIIPIGKIGPIRF